MGIQAARAGGTLNPLSALVREPYMFWKSTPQSSLEQSLDSGNTVKFVGVKWLKGFLSLF